ncbi:1,2-phenylacetyl-CoA epoxidase subunit PaaD [Hamadaea tsunoensis]|uniref:1,2-phenylacetyl-CoA epoxidase subunit PaaD n=1 Tax=Hamadaea tsunoensis TaxID=53368 RepID=UPI000405CBDD|nr:1,2-phenylacetyl-CoA epoxidase subunit PaaD [Hamadaea tsunoensis]
MVTALAAAAAVVDPELRVITIADLGVLRAVHEDHHRVRVELTPTYAGCPAMDAIRADVRSALSDAGYADVEIVTVLSPPWSTDMITEAGRVALAGAGIAPPTRLLTIPPLCPRCGSGRTEQISRFGATACQSLWRCRECQEPFDHVRKF